MRVAIGVSVLALSIAAGCAALADFSRDDPGFALAPGQFEGRFLAVADADMAGTAYADGQLEPFPGARDQISLFSGGRPVASADAPNSVISWPQIVDVSADGRRAYVVETRGAPAEGVTAVDDVYRDIPPGRALNVFEIAGDDLRTVAQVSDVGLNPQSVEVAPQDRFLVIATETPGAELVIVPLDVEGLPGEPRRISLTPPYRPDDSEPRVRNVHLAPDGRTLAANIANRRVQFYRLTPDAEGLPTSVAPLGEPIDVGVQLSVGRWTPDGRLFLITDVNAYASTFAMLTQRGGQVHVLEPPSEDSPARLLDSARVGRFAEGLELSDDGRTVASIAMERTYLPEWPVLETWPLRRRYLLSLLSLDPRTGALTELDRVQVAGVLPEDVIFDATGRNLAVAVFHRRKGEDRRRGFIDFFRITDQGELEAQGRTQPLMRGPHDLVRLPD